MQDVNDILSGFFDKMGSTGHIEPQEGMFVDKDGWVRCKVCGELREHELKQFPGHFVPCICACGRARRADEAIQRRESEQMRQAKELYKFSAMDEAKRSATFANATINDDVKRAFGVAKSYVEHWPSILRGDEPYKDMRGLLFYGPTGTGKSYVAACIANELLAQAVPVLVTSITRLVGNKDDELAETLRAMRKAKLLVLDDLGAERGTDYRLEQVYNVIDSRYDSRLPMVITTNLTMDQMKTGVDARYNRIWERIRSTCYPVKMAGGSWRKSKTLETMSKLRDIYGG